MREPDAKELGPPWAEHPEIPYGSIGWRMGYGESFLMRWHAWLTEQPRDRAHREAYLRRHPPAPRPWTRTVLHVLATDADDDDDDDDDEGSDDALVTEGLVGDDVALGAWEALHGEAPAAPWAAGWTRELPDAARYDARALTFWARWSAKRRADGRLATWLQSVPTPEPAWEPLRDAVRDGAVPLAFCPASAWELLAVLVAAHAEPPPPWERGEAPSSLHEDLDDDSSYADAWCSWVYEALDDGSSWRAYLERHAPAPPQWRDAIARVVYFAQ